MMLPIIGSALSLGMKLIERVIPDPVAKQAAQLKLLELQQAGELKEIDAAMQVVASEAQSEHWLTANWRPLLMTTFTAIIFNNYLLAPYLQAITGASVLLTLPPDMWTVLEIGIGGYILGRSAEKTAGAWKNGKNGNGG